MAKVDKHKLCTLLDEGIYNQNRLAKELGCSRQRVRQLLVKEMYEPLGGGRIQRSLKKILELRSQGKTYVQIAKELDCHMMTVYNAMKRVKEVAK